MVSCTKLEIGSLVFAFLSLLATAGGSVWYTVRLVKIYIKMASLTIAKENATESELSSDTGIWYLNYITYYIVSISMIISVLVLMFIFSIVLTKGLLTKKAHLVKAYFIFGVTGTTFSSIFALLVILGISLKVGFIIFGGCFVYSLLLLMIKKTYLKIAKKEHDQCCHKKIVEEKSMSIKL